MKKTTQEEFDELRLAIDNLKRTIETELITVIKNRRMRARAALILFGIMVLVAGIAKMVQK